MVLLGGAREGSEKRNALLSHRMSGVDVMA